MLLSTGPGVATNAGSLLMLLNFCVNDNKKVLILLYTYKMYEIMLNIVSSLLSFYS